MQNNVHIIGVSGGEEEKRESTKKLFQKIMAENFPNLERKMDV